jgi:hypothetical protein
VRVPAWAADARLAFRGEMRRTGAGYVTVGDLAAGDEFTLELPLTVRATRPDRRIDAVRGTVAFERGPEVFALESVDLPAGWSIDEVEVVAATARYDGGSVRVRLGRTDGHSQQGWPFGADDAGSPVEEAEVSLVRYHSWAERGPSTMRIWIPERSRR